LSSLRREVGFLHAIGQLRLKDILWPEGMMALVVGGVGGGVVSSLVDATARQDIAGDFLVLLGALLGIIFAGMAIVATMMSEDTVRWLSSDSGIMPFFAPWVVAVGLQILTILLAVAYRATALLLPPPAEAVWFVVLCILFVYAMADVLALTRTVVAHSIVRERALRLRCLEDERDRLDSRSR
jgi:hypothetical protein